MNGPLSVVEIMTILMKITTEHSDAVAWRSHRETLQPDKLFQIPALRFTSSVTLSKSLKCGIIILPIL